MPSARSRINNNTLIINKTNPFQDLVNEEPDTLVSVPFGSPLIDHLSHLHESNIEIRRSDWGLSGWKSTRFHIQAALKTARRARKYKSLLLCTANIENFVIALVKPWTLRRCKVRFYDPLIPSSMRVRSHLGPKLNGVDEIVVIRRGDEKTFRQSLCADRISIRYSPYPAPRLPKDLEISDEGYLYSGGAAHRDWDTLAMALEGLDIPCKIRMCNPDQWKGSRGPNMDISKNPPPYEARKIAAKARLIVVSMKDTDLPSGPLVLLDALQLRKSVIATVVNGTRDYLTGPEVDTKVYPFQPGNASALRASIRSAWDAKS